MSHYERKLSVDRDRRMSQYDDDRTSSRSVTQNTEHEISHKKSKRKFSRSRSRSSSSQERSKKKRKKSKKSKHRKKHKRRSSQSSDDSDYSSEDSLDLKKKTSNRKKKRRHRSPSSGDSESSIDSSEEERRRKKKSKKKHKKKLKKQEKMRRKSDQNLKKIETSSGPSAIQRTLMAMAQPASEAGPPAPEAPRRGPMTKEEWDKKQSVTRRVTDPETGRLRLIKGDGEIMEEIVSRNRHQQINKMATQGDGIAYSMRMGLMKPNT